MLPEKYREKSEKLGKLISKYGAFTVFIFAVTPLPDDIIYPVLGIMKIDLKSVFIAAFLGKTLLSAIVAYAGYYSYEFIANLLGEEAGIESAVITILLSIILTVAILILVFKVDWEKYIT